MDKLLLAYLAGVIDSDGYISIKRSTYAARVLGKNWNPQYQEMVGIKQVSPEAVDLLKAAFGGYRYVERPSARNGRPLHGWQGTNLIAAKALSALRPYLRIKARQADIALRLRVSKDSKVARLRGSPAKRKQAASVITERERLFAEVRALNDTRPQRPRLV